MRIPGIQVLVVLAMASAAPAADERAAAVVNGAPVLMRDLDAAVDRLLPRATYHGTVSEERRAEYWEKALEEVIDLELQYQDGAARGLKPDRGQAKERLQKMRGAFPSSDAYKGWLKRTFGSERKLREKIEKQLVVEAVTAAVREPSRMSDEALREYYDGNLQKFRQPESLRLRIFSAREESKANDALLRLSKGEDFGNVAARMSEDAYRIKGGDIGFVHRGRIYPALEEAAFRLQPGEKSGLIRTEGMWFIIKVEDRIPEHQISFDDAKDRLRKDLEGKRSDALMQAWMEGLREKAVIEISLPDPPKAGR